MTDAHAPPRIAKTFHTLILQPTTLCNLNCAYCYLPDRKRQRLMSKAVAESCAASIAEQASSSAVDVVWHGGEPTTTPLSHFTSLLEAFEPLRRAGQVRHNIQTNGTLLTAEWLDLFLHYDIRVGLSVDGPQAANAERVDWGGHETWQRTMRGARLLSASGLPFSVICVVTPATIDRVNELADFFAGLGCESVGFNLEEQEGSDRPEIDEEDAYHFWRRLVERRMGGEVLRIRDLDRLAEHLGSAAAAETHVVFDPIPTVAYNGQAVLLSPELLGIDDPNYGDFVAGNVLSQSLPAMLVASHSLRYVREFDQALRDCAASCDFYSFCRGAQAGNRYFELGTFAATETRYCRTTKQALVRAASDVLVREEVKTT
ncbi:cyclophane-forming radical SAM peptide maturase AmcB [Nocardioides speluncae]|uniref:cyclophane-forming radical SAM peptide maturase AmcB n=1 Tax=Nocardioides speluncae TaxID=2670337 RepID=UPI000D68724B|nr:cyclophane-forming radical SAM peptide maturase AmcB [Nocardioides speluncae]